MKSKVNYFLCVFFTIVLSIIFIYALNSFIKKDVPEFPSYDWSAEDTYYLAKVSANGSSDYVERQEEIINVLECVWETNTDIKTYILDNFDLLKNEPTYIDYQLIDLVKQRKWYK